MNTNVVSAVGLMGLTLCGCSSSGGSGSAESGPQQISLFDGKSLDGWVQRGGSGVYFVEDGIIVGESRPNQPNSFLCTVEDYADFELQLDFRVDDGMNSGIQIRSASSPEYRNGTVYGYQIEIDPSGRAWTGGLYDESRRGWLDDLSENEAAQQAFIHNDWNHFKIVARGDRIQTWLNGVAAADYVDDDPTASGFIALQLHGVGDRVEPLRVRWRNIYLKELD